LITCVRYYWMFRRRSAPAIALYSLPQTSDPTISRRSFRERTHQTRGAAACCTRNRRL
jgi:hypothetical protein